MSAAVWGWALALGQVVLLAVLAPYLVGITRAVRARLEGRGGGRLGQPWRDLRKQLRKPPTSPPRLPCTSAVARTTRQCSGR